MNESGARTTEGDGPGWSVAAVLFAIGIALGSMITRAPLRARMPMATGMKHRGGPGLPSSFVTLLPFYTAALAFPVFLWLARRAPLTRATWQRSVMLWLIALVIFSVLPDFIMLALFAT